MRCLAGSHCFDKSRLPNPESRIGHLGTRPAQPLRHPDRARRPGPGRAPRRDPRRGRRLGYRQVGADAQHPRPARARCRPHQCARRGHRVQAPRRPPARGAQYRRAVPGRRAVLLAERGRERAGTAEGALRRTARQLALRTGAAEGETGRTAGRCDQQAALAAVRRHAQARRAGARAGAGPAAAVPRRAHRRAGPDRRGRLRPPDPHPAGSAGPDRVPHHPRPGHLVRYLRPRGGAGRPQGHRHRAAGRDRAGRPPLDPGLFPRPARARPATPKPPGPRPTEPWKPKPTTC